MEFEHKEHADLHAHVDRYLRHEFGQLVAASDDEPVFLVDIDGRSFVITVSANGPDTAVMVYTRVADGVTITPEVARFLLRTAHEEMPFGTVGLKDDNVIAVHHVVFGESVTQERLRELLTTLTESCESLDEGLARLALRPPGPRPIT